MITTIKIENFKSLRDVTLNLQRVNLLIGPNNSGKSNFLKGLVFLAKNNHPSKFHIDENFVFNKNSNNIFTFSCYVNKGEEVVNFEKKFKVAKNTTSIYEQLKEAKIIEGYLSFLPLYSIDIAKIKQPTEAKPNIYQVNDDASDLVSFLDNMQDERKDIIRKIEADLQRCIPEFENISFRKVNTDKVTSYTHKKIGLTTKNGDTYWADELSDGTLYFLALLCIVNQPNPPKILLLEEPENGIHPRRVKEIMDYIFDLAEEKDLQVIMTTHSTYVIDQFKDIPESIFVFDKEGDETKVKNLQDFINEDAEKAKKDGMPTLDLSGSLGDHWASGLIGGVPR